MRACSPTSSAPTATTTARSQATARPPPPCRCAPAPSRQLVWNRTRESNRLRNALLQYFPAALRAFADLTHRDALSVLAIAPEPRAAARLSMTQLRSALRRGGRTRNVERRAAEIRAALRVRTLEVAPAVSEAFADSTRAEVAQLQEINRQLAALESKLAASFEEHPDAAVYLSMPGLGTVLGGPGAGRVRG